MNRKAILSAAIGIGAIISGVVVALPLLSSKPDSPAAGAGLPEAKPAQVVELKNGDTYDLTAGYVEKELGNRTYKMMAYNGSIPGPIIKAPQGAEVTINFKNDTDMETALHSHGVRLDNASDGATTVTQDAVQPGETFTYKIKFSDAGMYWYHPHVREDYQQELGMYGNYLVTPNNPGYWNQVNREVPLFLDDILIDGDGQIKLSRTEADRTLMGRFGNMMLTNGEPAYSLEAKKGEVMRLYITNAASARVFNFSIPGVKMKLVGGDAGASEREEWKDSVIIGPSERAVVEVFFDKAGSFKMESVTTQKSYKLGTVTVSGEAASPSYAAAFANLRTNQAVVKSIEPYRSYFDKPLDKRLSLTIDMKGMDMEGMGGMDMGGRGTTGSSLTSSGGMQGHMMPNGVMMQGSMLSLPGADGIEWEDEDPMMNEMSNKAMTEWKIVDEDTGKVNKEIGWRFKVGDRVKIRINNDPDSEHPMQHPIHFHGQRFLVLDKNGEKNNNLVWKDTVLIPKGQYVDILLDVSNPGQWMSHCHVAEHLEADMMFTFDVAG